MIYNTRQIWEIGEVVNVGFLRLRVLEKRPTPGDYLPDVYILCGLGDKAGRKYQFTPHHGVERI